MLMHRHFTASAFIIDSKKRVLLVWHKHLQSWMPPGGHIDENELPEDAALRECKEETGLDVEIIGNSKIDLFAGNPAEGRMLQMPVTMLLEEIPASEKKGQPAHQHMDFVFLARPLDETQECELCADEHEELRWFTLAEVETLKNDEIFTNVKNCVRDFLQNRAW